MKKVSAILKGFLKRLSILPGLRKYDRVFIHREAAPIGPPVFEWLVARFFRKKVIFDFDDAIWLPNTSGENRLAAKLKFHPKTAAICKWSYKVSAGNEYLAAFARKYNSKVIVNPTTIDTNHFHNQIKDQYTDKVVIGWTGSHSTLKYLDMIIPVLKKLEKIYHFEFIVIADKNPDIKLRSFSFLKWKKDTEVDDLLKINIGIMPLTDDQWSMGKCGFKALQFMALGIPTLASPVGVNQDIIDHGEDGFLCRIEEEWLDKLKLLIKRPELRHVMGANARKKIEDRYSVACNTRTFLNLFK